MVIDSSEKCLSDAVLSINTPARLICNENVIISPHGCSLESNLPLAFAYLSIRIHVLLPLIPHVNFNTYVQDTEWEGVNASIHTPPAY